jgi:hypothetical protein
MNLLALLHAPVPLVALLEPYAFSNDGDSGDRTLMAAAGVLLVLAISVGFGLMLDRKTSS